MKKDKIE